jgi:hypothetical protein
MPMALGVAFNREGALPRSFLDRIKKLTSSNQIGRAAAFLAD